MQAMDAGSTRRGAGSRRVYSPIRISVLITAHEAVDISVCGGRSEAKRCITAILCFNDHLSQHELWDRRGITKE